LASIWGAAPALAVVIGGASARRRGRLLHGAQHLGEALLLVALELSEHFDVGVLRLLQGDLAGFQRDHAGRHGLLHPLLFGLAHLARRLIVQAAARRRARALAGRGRRRRRGGLRPRRFDEGEGCGGDGREARQNESSIHGVSPWL
jgi:hypothetical protein